MIARLAASGVGFILLGLLSACASQPAGSAASSGAQAATAGPKCEVDVKRICQQIRNAPVVDSQTGQTQDATELEQNQPRTTREFVSQQIPNGSMLEVSCEMNAAHRSVVYAHLMPGPPLTSTDVAYLQNAGYCVP